MSSFAHKNVVLLYYKFAAIADTAAFRDAHFEKALQLGLKGRVYVASEGINGTVAGTPDAINAYKAYVESFDGFQGIHWKEEACDALPFAKLKVKIRPFLINFGSANMVDPQEGGQHVEPHQWRQELEAAAQNQNEYVILDVRNQYESDVGYFEGAIRPQIEHFSDFPQWVKDLIPHKDKKVLMYCTGGIRCEKFSALLVKEGFKNVKQLKGGILNYVKTEGTQHWKGRCFVFDDRLSVATAEQSAPISQCLLCKQPEDRQLNCSNMICNRLIIICDACAHQYLGACCSECRDSPGRRPFDAQNFRIPFRKKGLVFKELGLANRKRPTKRSTTKHP